MKRSKIKALAVIIAIGVTGCAVGPDYRKPEVSVPSSFHEMKDKDISAQPAKLSRWWSAFNDPVMDSLIEQAINSNLDLRSADIRIKGVRASRGITDSDLWPKVNAAGSLTQNRISENTPQGKRAQAADDIEYNLYQAGFDASWEIDIFGGVRRALEAADAEIGVSIEDRRSVLVTLLGDVARNYIELRGVQRQLKIIRENLELQEETQKLIQERYKAGLGSYLDVARVEAQVASTSAQIPLLEKSLKQTIHRLSVLSGQEPGALWQELSKEAPIPVAPSDVVAGLPSDLLRRRPDIRRAEREMAAASARIGVATADLFPRFSLTGQFGVQGENADDLSSSSSLFWLWGPSVRWPVFTAGRISANIAVQDARYEQAISRYEQTVLTALEDVENALVAWSMERVRHKSLMEAAAANRQAAAMARELYTKGLTDFLDVLEAERFRLASESQLAQSETALSTNLVALSKALGGGWEL